MLKQMQNGLEFNLKNDVAEKTGEDIEVSAVQNVSIKNEWQMDKVIHNWFYG